MKIRQIALIAALAAASAGPSLTFAQTAPSDKVKPVFQEPIANIPGKSLVGILVEYPPGGTSRAHYHPHSAFISAYVLTGSIRSQVNQGQERVFRAGEHWTEPPDAYHPVSANASATEPASLLAVFVVDTADVDKLVTYERK